MFRISVSKLGASSGNYGNISKGVSKQQRGCVWEERSKRRNTKAFKIQMEAGLSKFESYVLEHLGTRGKMKEALSCMFETWHNPIARPLGSN